MFVDYHAHKRLCGHATGEIDEYVERAAGLGLLEIGFADHVPMEIWGRPDSSLTMRLADVPTYLAEVREAQAHYGGRVRVRIGWEADFVPGKERELRDFLAAHPCDYIIGSVHFLGDWGFDDARELSRWDHRAVDEVYQEYLSTLLQAIDSRLFDIVGHADLVKKFGHRASQDLAPWYECLAEAIAQAGMAVEINTSGLRKPVGEMYPHADLLRACIAAHVPVVLGSDAHQPADVARDFGRAAALARRLGCRGAALFASRRIVGTVPLVTGPRQGGAEPAIVDDFG
jgi:histidinol-phosphatase (PHP family)